MIFIKIKFKSYKIQLLQADYDEQSLHLRVADEKNTKYSQEVKRLEEELYCERQNTVNETSLRKTFECKLRELEIKYENNNMMISTNGKKHLEKLESKLKSLETELELEKRKSRDAAKFSRQMERNYKDMEYQFYQEKRNFERLEVLNKQTKCHIIKS